MFNSAQLKNKIVAVGVCALLFFVLAPGAHAALKASPSSITFANQAVGSASAPIAVTWTNTGTGNVTIKSINSSLSQFSYSGPAFPLTLGPGKSIVGSVTFKPSAAQLYRGSLVITRGNNTSSSISLSGTGTSTTTGYTIYSSPQSLSFSAVVGGAVPAAQPININDTTPAPLPFTLSADQSWITLSTSSSTTQPGGVVLQFGVNPAGQIAGVHTGHILLAASGIVNSPLSIPVTLNMTAATSGVLSASPSSIAFGSVNTGSNSTKVITFTNTGSASLTISKITPSGAGITSSGMTLPLTLGTLQSATLSVKFAPTVVGAVAGSISVVSNATPSSVTIPVTGTGATATTYTIKSAPASFTFSSTVGGAAPANQSASISDTAPTAISFTLSADQPWIMLSATSGTAQSGGTVSLQFGANPSGMVAGNYSGHIMLTASGVSNSPMSIPVTLAVAAGTSSTLTASASSVAIGSVNVGASGSKSVVLTNSGTAPVTISQVNVTGTGLSASGFAMPLTLNAAQTTVLTIAFAPKAPGAISGSASVVSNATNSPLVISATATGTQAQLSANPLSFDFGNVTVNSSGSHTITLTNGGTSSATISAASTFGTGYSMTGLTIPLTLAAGVSTSFSVQFAPLAAGSVAGNVTLTSNTPNSPTIISLAGAGVAAVQHSVSLSWNASTSPVVSYNIYVASVSGGPYALVGSTQAGTLAFTDNSVTSGKTYFFMVTAVDANGVESVDSNIVSVIIP